MSILVKGTDFGTTEQVTSTKLDNLVDAAKFTNTSETAVPYSGGTGTCLQGGGLEVTSAGQLQVKDAEITTVKLNDNAVTTVKITDLNVTTAKIANDAITGDKINDTTALPDGVTGTTQTAGNNTTKIATTAFVNTAVSSNGLSFSILKSASGGVRTDSSNYYKDMSEAYDPYNLISFSGGDITFASTGTYLVEIVGTFNDADTSTGPPHKYGLTFTSSTSSSTSLLDQVTNVSYHNSDSSDWHPYSASYIRTISDVSTDKLAVKVTNINSSSATAWQSQNVILKIIKLT